MPSLAELVAYCDQRTRRAAFVDAPGAVNGLQVANDGRVTKIGAAVDAGAVPHRLAVEAGVDFLIVHHGMYWDMPLPITGKVYDRVAPLIRGNCALYSNHLPLDSHPEIGNNALMIKELGLTHRRGYFPNPGGDIGLISTGMPRAALRAKLEKLYARVIAIECGSENPAEVAFCSGRANSAVPLLVPAGVDTLVCGELAEEFFNQAQEEKLNLYVCGHYATEVHGVRALALELAEKFKLPYTWLPTGNPL